MTGDGRLRLVTVRHAKARLGDPAEPDHARPLAPRGRRGARAVAAWLAAQPWRPEVALVSDARRTRETWALLAPALGEPEVRFLPELFHAPATTILDLLRRHGRGETVLVVGHNPGLAEVAAGLAATPPDHPGWARHPTGATTVLDFELPHWAGLGWGQGRVASFVVPRDLRPGEA